MVPFRALYEYPAHDYNVYGDADMAVTVFVIVRIEGIEGIG
jgi:hypothetical protein